MLMVVPQLLLSEALTQTQASSSLRLTPLPLLKVVRKWQGLTPAVGLVLAVQTHQRN
jgi:hypothetical protein